MKIEKQNRSARPREGLWPIRTELNDEQAVLFGRAAELNGMSVGELIVTLASAQIVSTLATEVRRA